MRYLLGLGFLPFGNMIEHAIDIFFVSWDAFGTVRRFLCCSYMYTIVSLIAFVVKKKKCCWRFLLSHKRNSCSAQELKEHSVAPDATVAAQLQRPGALLEARKQQSPQIWGVGWGGVCLPTFCPGGAFDSFWLEFSQKAGKRAFCTKNKLFVSRIHKKDDVCQL